MNTSRLSRYAIAISPLIIPLISVILMPLTSTVPATILPTADPNQVINEYPPKTEGLAKFPLAENLLYLPIVLRDATLPSVPTLYDIDNADGDGSYVINWSTSGLATSYSLEEDVNANFSNPTVIYSGSDTTKAIVSKALGSYYYRVRAENGMGYSGWSQVKNANVTQQTVLICETHNFGTPGISHPILPSGSTDHFTAENNMLVETVEVKSVLKALFPVNVYVAVGINGEQLANKTHYVFSNAYTPYYINKDVAKEIHVGDDIYYYIAKAVGDTEAWIAWGNYVKLCGR